VLKRYCTFNKKPPHLQAKHTHLLFFPSTFKYCFQFKNVFFTAGTEAQDPLCHLLAVTMPLLTASSPTVYLKASFVGNWCDHFWLFLYSSSSPRIYQKTSTPLTSPHAIIKQKKNSLILHKKKNQGIYGRYII